MPFWRAVLSPLWCINLILDLRKNVKNETISLVFAVFLSIAYFVLSIVWRLPDPYWIATYFAFVPLLPVVRLINASNQGKSQYVSNSTWKLRHFVLALFCIPLLSFNVSSSVGLIPSTQVVRGSWLWPHHREYLENAGIIEANKQILFFTPKGCSQSRTMETCSPIVVSSHIGGMKNRMSFTSRRQRFPILRKSYPSTETSLNQQWSPLRDMTNQNSYCSFPPKTAETDYFYAS